MKSPRTALAHRFVRRISLLASIALFSACPLPYEFSGEGASDALSRDPASPDVTAPVAVAYTQASGPSGSIANGSNATTGSDTTVTLSTATENAVIYYTTDGTEIDSFSQARRIEGSEGSLDLRIDDPGAGNSQKTLDVHEVAVGPGMYPSPVTSASVTVDYYVPPRAIVSGVALNDATLPQARTGALLYALEVVVEGAGNTIEGLTVRLGGSLDAGDVRRMQLWLSDDSAIDGSDTLIANLFSNAGYTSGATVSFAPSRALDPGTHYLLITTTIDSLATAGNSIFIEGVNLSDISFPNTLTVEGPTTLPAGPVVAFSQGTDSYAKVSQTSIYDRILTLSNITINGLATTSRTVPVGEPVSLVFDFQSTAGGTYCPSCIVQVYAGIRGVAEGCVSDFVGYNFSVTGYQLSFTPTEPGLYYLTLGATLDFNCQPNPENRVGYFDGNQNFAVVIAQ
jgi:hypothetical protein